MIPVQPALDGSMPEPKTHAARRRAEDFEEWLAEVRPAFERAAASGAPFTSYEIADREQLPEPPNSQSHWGRLISILRDDDVIAQYGWANSVRPGDNGSAVKVWRGTPAARQGRVARTGEAA